MELYGCFDSSYNCLRSLYSSSIGMDQYYSLVFYPGIVGSIVKKEVKLLELKLIKQIKACGQM